MLTAYISEEKIMARKLITNHQNKIVFTHFCTYPTKKRFDFGRAFPELVPRSHVTRTPSLGVRYSCPEDTAIPARGLWDSTKVRYCRIYKIYTSIFSVYILCINIQQCKVTLVLSNFPEYTE